MLAMLQMAVAQLKSWLQEKGLSHTGNKPVLIERVEDYYERK